MSGTGPSDDLDFKSDIWEPVWSWLHNTVVYGDLPTWLAFAGAAIAVYYTHQTSKREEARDNRYEDAQRREQANHVGGWIDFQEVMTEGTFETKTERGVVYRNISGLPVYEARIYTWSKAFYAEAALEPDEAFDIGLIPPSRSGWQAITNAQTRWGHKCALYFVDSANRAWYRDMYGVLTESTETGDPHKGDLAFSEVPF